MSLSRSGTIIAYRIAFSETYSSKGVQMGPLTHDVQVLGKAAMEESLTFAARARRRFKAGRPTKSTGIPLSPLESMTRAVKEYAKLQDLTQDEAEKQEKTFDPNDTKAALVYCTPEVPSRSVWLPPSRDGIKAFVDEINGLSNAVFLGMVFYQFDRDAKKEAARHTFWVLQFVAGPAAETQLRDERDKARSQPLRN